MAKSPTPLRIASSSNPTQIPVARAVTRRESDLLTQVNELKEKLVLAEIAMDDKEAKLHKAVRKARAQKSYINQFEKKVDDIKLKNLDVTDKFYQLKSVATRASEIARKKHNQLKQIEKDLEKHQQELMVTKRIQAQLMDVVIKQSHARPQDKMIAAEDNDPVESTRSGIGQSLLQLPKTVGEFLHSQSTKKSSSFDKAKQQMNALKTAYSSKLSLTLENNKVVERFNSLLMSRQNSEHRASKSKARNANKKLQNSLPKIQWCRVSNALPLRSGLYYVTDGKQVDIALFDATTQQFKRTSGSFTIDFWCEKPGK